MNITVHRTDSQSIHFKNNFMPFWIFFHYLIHKYSLKSVLRHT